MNQIVPRPETHPEQAERMAREATCECGHIERFHPIAACWSPGSDCTCQFFRTSKPAAVKRTFASLSVDQRQSVFWAACSAYYSWVFLTTDNPREKRMFAVVRRFADYIAGDEQ